MRLKLAGTKSFRQAKCPKSSVGPDLNRWNFLNLLANPTVVQNSKKAHKLSRKFSAFECSLTIHGSSCCSFCAFSFCLFCFKSMQTKLMFGHRLRCSHNFDHLSRRRPVFRRTEPKFKSKARSSVQTAQAIAHNPSFIIGVRLFDDSLVLVCSSEFS